MSLHEGLDTGVVLKDVFDAFRCLESDRDALAAVTGWFRESIDTIDAYEGVTASYLFPTLQEWRALFAGQFKEVSLHIPTYELGERCPSFELQKHSY